MDLAAAIRRRELTSAEVVGAHVQRLRATHARINAVVAERYDDALTQARACDHRIAGGALRGAPADDLPPLFGVPFTVKESIAVRGMPQSAGVQARAGQTSIQNAAAVQRLIDAGAIPLGVTNVSELTLWIESDNPVYGRTNNPYDQSRTAGGSSGGEAATVAIGGSPFGIGADIGGSIRIPALFCGVFGHKPSSGLVPTTGLWPPVAEAAEPLLTVGPITRRAEDLLPLLRILSGGSSAASSADSIAGALDDTGDVSLVGLTVTTVSGSSLRPFSRALQNARERAVGALASAGATVRVVNLPSWRQALLPFLAMLHDDRANGSGPTHAALGISETSRLDLFQLLTGANGHTLPTRLALAAELLPTKPEKLRALTARARSLAEELIEAIGGGVLLHPAHLTSAPHHRFTYGRPWLITPTAVFNLAGVPVTEVPMGLDARGLPVGIQVAAAPGADYLSIAVAIELEAVLGGWRPPLHLGAPNTERTDAPA